jgi:uncharacterized protein YndB with AHSA1/START domain
MTVHGMHREVSLHITARPDDVFDLVADLPRMGEWSPENDGGEWQDGGIGAVGDRFIGVNRRNDYEWSVLCEVTAADRGRVFEWVTRPDIGPCVRWRYELTPSGDGTDVTEIWDVEQLPPSLQSRTPEQLAERSATVEAGMHTTLANMKAFLER